MMIGENKNVININLQDVNSLRLLDYFYNNVYQEGFPDENERETLENLYHYLKQNDKNTDCNYHITLILQNSMPVGGAIYDYFNEINSGVIEFLVIQEKFRHHHLGIQLYQYVIETLSDDAKHIGNNELYSIFIEIDENNILAKSFWQRYGFKQIVFDYIQPSLGANKEAVNNLILAITLFNDDITLPSKVLYRFLINYMIYCMQIDKPDKEYIGVVLLNEYQRLIEIK